MGVEPRTLQWGRNFFVTEIYMAGHTLHRGSPCFNGAVTFSLRKSPKNVGSVFTLWLLQWGRNFFVTEIGNLKMISSNLFPLQWGRNFFVTEIEYYGRKPLTVYYGFNGAVTFSLRKSTRVIHQIFLDLPCFNGAVTFSLRK